jgi:hypothetical protein
MPALFFLYDYQRSGVVWSLLPLAGISEALRRPFGDAEAGRSKRTPPQAVEL